MKVSSYVPFYIYMGTYPQNCFGRVQISLKNILFSTNISDKNHVKHCQNASICFSPDSLFPFISDILLKKRGQKYAAGLR